MRRHFKTSDQHEINHVIIIRFISAVEKHFAAAGGQRNVVFMLDQEPSSVSAVHKKRAERLSMKQFSNFIGLHGWNCSGELGLRKRGQFANLAIYE